MKTHRMHICLLVLAVLALAGGARPLPAAVVVSLSPPARTVNLGDSVEVALGIAGLGDLDEPALAAFEISVAYPGAQLRFTSAVFGDPLLGDQLALEVAPLVQEVQDVPSGFDPAQRLVILIEDSGGSLGSLESFQLDSFTLVTLLFTATAVGTSELGVFVDRLTDGQGNPIVPGLTGEGAATITAVPEPSSVAFILAGFAVLALWVRRSPRRSSVT